MLDFSWNVDETVRMYKLSTVRRHDTRRVLRICKYTVRPQIARRGSYVSIFGISGFRVPVIHVFRPYAWYDTFKTSVSSREKSKTINLVPNPVL